MHRPFLRDFVRVLCVLGLSGGPAACGSEPGPVASVPDAQSGADAAVDAGPSAAPHADGGSLHRRDAGHDVGEPPSGEVDASLGDAASDASVRDAGADAALPEPWDPGPMPWEVVPADQVLEVCRLDPEALSAADAALNKPWAVIRYGKLCHHYRAEGMAPLPAWSATKTLGALVLGMVAYETKDLPKPLSDTDPVSRWLSSFSYNPSATIAHVLGMVAHNESLAYGERTMVYDTLGDVQINSLSQVMNLALAQDAARLGDLDAFTQRFLFDRLGMVHSVWSEHKPDKLLGFSWVTDVFDMAKLGQLMLRGGVWNGERLLDADYVYRMTHPSFEDANTGYGYLTWLNASAGWTLGAGDFLGTPLPDASGIGAINPGPCAPVALWAEYPHGDAPDCNYGAVRGCDQEFDVGVWQAVGLFGQVIQGHRGLDMVLVGMNLTEEEGITPDFRNAVNPSAKLWDAVRPAVIKGDPVYQGDEASFCAAYGNNAYAPDLVPW